MHDIFKQINVANALRITWSTSDFKRDNGINPANVKTIADIPYTNSGCPEEEIWNLTDIYYPEFFSEEKYPVIVSVHGGGWFYGNKEIYSLYTKYLASTGFAVVNFNYRQSPEHKYPAAFLDVCNLMNFISVHASEYMLDMNRLYMVGDSAGAQLASQYSILACSEKYRCLFPETSKLSIPLPDKIALNCGFYEILPPHSETLCDWYLPENMDKTSIETTLNIIEYMTHRFPAVYLMTSVNDPMKVCSQILLDKLVQLNIPHIYREFGQNNINDGHVFHLNMRSADGQKCNHEEIEFFNGTLFPEK